VALFVKAGYGGAGVSCPKRHYRGAFRGRNALACPERRETMSRSVWKYVPLVVALVFWVGSCQQAAQKGGPSLPDVSDGTSGDGGEVLVDVPGLRDLPADGGEEPLLDVKREDRAEPDMLGEPCEATKDCPEDWYCVDVGDGRVCTRICDPVCPSDYDCKPVRLTGGADETYLCMPASANICTDCSDGSDCGRLSHCVMTPTEEEPDGATCLRRCGEGEDVCRAKHECRAAPLREGGEEVDVCMPSPGTGCCAEATKDEVEACARQNEHGTCEGEWVCRGNRGWGACSAMVPAEERCDTIDNDCDGDTDEELPNCSCGDGECSPLGGEDLKTCPADCAECGDGICSPGEGPFECERDCCGACGDGQCVGYACGEDPNTCPEDCSFPCGDGSCDQGENPVLCPDDCSRFECGDEVCDPLDGGPEDCPEDCAEFCGNCES